MNYGNFRFFLTSLLLGCVTLLVVACSEPVVVEKKLRPVKSMLVQTGSASRSRIFSGTAQAAQEADLSFKVAGSVEQVLVEVGDNLARGALVARLDDETYRVELEQIRADAAQANAQRRSAEAEYQRVRQLYANDNASRNELDSALADAESAKASQDAAVQSARLAALNLDYTQLTVDYDCTIAQLDMEPNENVNAGQVVATASCGEGWEVQIDVPESLIANFADGMAGVVRFPSVPGQTFAAEVTEVSIGTGSRSTFPVTLALNDTPTNIRTNLAAEAEFEFTEQSGSDNTIYLPSAAVVQDQNGTFVYVVETHSEPGTAMLVRRNVEVGELSALGLEVLAGLQAGERVLVAGQVNARDGLLVRDQ